MRAANGTLTTALMFVPLLAVPLLAIFGTPQSMPATASARTEAQADPLGVDLGVGQSDFPAADDLFAPFGEPGAADSRSSPAASPSASEPDDPWDQAAQRLERRASAADRHRAVPNRPARDKSATGASVPADWADSFAQTDPADRIDSAPEWYDDSTRPSETAGHKRTADPFDSAAPRGPSPRDVAQPAVDSGNSFLSVTDDPRRNPPGEAPSRGVERQRQDNAAPFATPPSRPDTLRESQSRPADDARPFAPRGERAAGQSFASSTPADASGSQGPLTWRTAVTRLNEMGIHEYQLGPGSREYQFHFSCLYSPGNNPRLVHRFESEADDPLAAVADAIRQIETWQSRNN